MLKKLKAWIKENIIGDGTEKNFGSQKRIKNDACRLLNENEATRHVDIGAKERVVDKTLHMLRTLDVPTPPSSVQDFLLSDLVLPVAVDVLTRIAMSEYEGDEERENELIRASLDVSLNALSQKQTRGNEHTDST